MLNFTGDPGRAMTLFTRFAVAGIPDGFGQETAKQDRSAEPVASKPLRFQASR